LYIKRHYEAVRLQKSDGSIEIVDPAREDLLAIDMSILEQGNQRPPYLVEPKIETSPSIVGYDQVHPRDLGKYLNAGGIRVLQQGYELDTQYPGFARSYFAVPASDLTNFLFGKDILRKIQNANGDHFIWPRFRGNLEFAEVDREDYKDRVTDLASCDGALLLGNKTRYLQ
jgi:hypothetical protein